MDNKKEENKSKGFKVRKSPVFKLKDKIGRHYIVITLSNFGFIPEQIIIEKVHGQNNKFFVMAPLTKAQIEKEEIAEKAWLEKQKKLKIKTEKKDDRQTVQTDKPVTQEKG